MRHRTGSGDEILPTSNHHGAERPEKRQSGLMSKIADFVREFGLDWATILMIGIVALMIDKYVPDVGGKARYFRLLPGESTSPQMEAFGHPYRKQIITFWTSAGLDVGIPALFISVLEIFKTLAGGYRPSWFEICKPQPDGPGVGFDGTWYKWTICTGDQEKINWALESFPSGHVATSFAAAVFLSLYINAKLKIFSDYRVNPIIMVLFLTPLTLAVLMGGAISADMSHHSYDIVGGAILGTFVAFLTFRSFYVSIFDPRTNHIGLRPSRRFQHRPEVDYCEYQTRAGFPVFSYNYHKV
ncbi:hypothetical protein AOL_s00004g14 [Orbilia oligospora ATCC 24927]|uniref:Phosphatidic acid phosphatase type 2/haloperoxidase domain-containing protein n=1 Tax=Arthrobotrys oligospora (strain ATCC 24927 / CBS 115.81 / DSM 1491) TaxID=756982 RepID=G1WXK4_ARTOA|nr:hypothetical protein AOL_s00004g14 [Orbilia oligospora ATCC 24927]EGX54365.1 hypothetical protein AOL_s00004g14 [Orbilia oligospora ATCC 24927]